MRRRSLIITVFCLGEMVFAIQLITQTELVKSEVKEWNKGDKKRSNQTIEGLLACSQVNATGCCDSATLKAIKGTYTALKGAQRKSEYLKAIVFPLIAIVAANALAACMYNSGTLDFVKLIKMRCIPEACITRMSFMLWCICWMAEIGIGVFVVIMSALAKSNLFAGKAKKLAGHELCTNSGQKVEKYTEDQVNCFRKLKVCPTTEEQTLIASLLLTFFVIICAVFKIGYRFFLLDDDSERFECPNCCRCASSKADKVADPKDGGGDQTLTKIGKTLSKTTESKTGAAASTSKSTVKSK